MINSCNITPIDRRRLLAEGPRVQSRVILYESHRGQNCNTVDFYPNYFLFSLLKYYSIIAPYSSTNDPVVLTRQPITISSVFKYVASSLCRDIPDYGAKKLVTNNEMDICCM
jgi:hypothetical protein